MPVSERVQITGADLRIATVARICFLDNCLRISNISAPDHAFIGTLEQQSFVRSYYAKENPNRPSPTGVFVGCAGLAKPLGKNTPEC